MLSAEALATVNVRVLTKLFVYIDNLKEKQRSACNYLELNQIYQLLRYGSGLSDILIC